MNKREEIEKELGDLGSSLKGIPKSNPPMPEGFLDGFEAKMMAKIKAEETSKPEPKVIPIVRWRQYAIAASVALVLGLSFIFTLENQKPTQCVDLACLDEQLIESYIEENIDSYEEELLDEIDFEDIYESSVEEDYLLDELDESTIMEAL